MTRRAIGFLLVALICIVVSVLAFNVAPAHADVCEGFTVTPGGGDSFIVELTTQGPGMIRVDRDGEVATYTPEDATTATLEGLPVWVLYTEGAASVYVILPDNGSGAPDPSCGITVPTGVDVPAYDDTTAQPSETVSPDPVVEPPPDLTSRYTNVPRLLPTR